MISPYEVAPYGAGDEHKRIIDKFRTVAAKANSNPNPEATFGENPFAPATPATRARAAARNPFATCMAIPAVAVNTTPIAAPTDNAVAYANPFAPPPVHATTTSVGIFAKSPTERVIEFLTTLPTTYSAIDSPKKFRKLLLECPKMTHCRYQMKEITLARYLIITEWFELLAVAIEQNRMDTSDLESCLNLLSSLHADTNKMLVRAMITRQELLAKSKIMDLTRELNETRKKAKEWDAAQKYLKVKFVRMVQKEVGDCGSKARKNNIKH